MDLFATDLHELGDGRVVCIERDERLLDIHRESTFRYHLVDFKRNRVLSHLQTFFKGQFFYGVFDASYLARDHFAGFIAVYRRNKAIMMKIYNTEN